MFNTLSDSGRGLDATLDLPTVQARLDVDLAGQISVLLGAVSDGDGTEPAAREIRLARLLGDDFISLQETRLRRVMLLVEEFRSQCETGANARLLSVVLKAVIRRACHTFSAVTQGRRGATHFAADNDTCLVDLLRMLETLSADEMPPAFELAHAMDALIIQLVRIEAALEDVGAMRPSLRAKVGAA